MEILSRIWKRIWNDISRGENIDFYLTVVAALVLATLSLMGADVSNWLTPVTLAILALLAVSNLVNRDRLVGLRSAIELFGETLNKVNRGRPTAATFFHTRLDTPLPAKIKDAKTLDMIGTSLISVTITNQALIRHLKDSGSRIRLLVSNPYDDYLSQIYSARFREADTPEQHATNVRTSIANLQMLVGTSSSGGNVEARMTRQDISFSYIGVNTGSLLGIISIEMYLNKLPLNENPMFTISAVADPHWFGVFKSQFEVLWNNAEAIHTSNTQMS
jgi:hypothetical protein